MHGRCYRVAQWATGDDRLVRGLAHPPRATMLRMRREGLATAREIAKQVLAAARR
jgi:hypothetical protein